MIRADPVRVWWVGGKFNFERLEIQISIINNNNNNKSGLKNQLKGWISMTLKRKKNDFIIFLGYIIIFFTY